MTTLAERMRLPIPQDITLQSEGYNCAIDQESEGITWHDKSLDGIHTLLEELSNPQLTGSYEKFKPKFQALLDWVKTNKRKHLMISSHVARVVWRCAKEEKFWPKEELRHLIMSGLIPSSACLTLITSLVDHREIALVHSCLLNISDIPEPALAKCLEFFLGLSDTKLTEVSDDHISHTEDEINDDCPFTQTKSSYINSVLTYPHDGVFLLDHIRKVEFGLVLDLMKYLLFLVANNCCEKPAGKSISAEVGKRDTSVMAVPPTLMQVVDWLGLILDAHFSQMVLSNEARTFLVELHTAVENKVQFFDELVSLEAILTQLKEKSIIPHKQNVGFYCIQTLHVH